ncbi:MBL fold metallo-hydrolase, partial [bacterium]|nr:MBL fold metallo-hydrolase [bacterium]
MSTADLHVIVDPNFPQYLYAAEPLAAAYTTRTGGKKGASLLLGEWMKIIEPDAQLPATGRIHVAYRGGEGYVNPRSASRRRCLEVFFIDVDQGDSILIQTPDDRRVLIDGGESADALEFIRNKYRLDKKDHYVDFEAVVATHSDADHTQGLLRILRHPRIAVKRVYHNGLFRRTDAAKDPGRREDGRVFGLVHAPSANAVPEMKALMKSFVEAVATARANLPGILDKMRQLPRWKGRVEPPPGGFQFRRLDAADKYLPPYDRQNKHLAIEVLGPRASGKGAKASYPWY